MREREDRIQSFSSGKTEEPQKRSRSLGDREGPGLGYRAARLEWRTFRVRVVTLHRTQSPSQGLGLRMLRTKSVSSDSFIIRSVVESDILTQVSTLDGRLRMVVL